MKLDFWFDPACPWTWATSRWLVEVTGARGHEVTWRPYSLPVKNGVLDGTAPEGMPDHIVEAAKGDHRALRVVAAVRREDPAGVGPLYTELGRRFHHDGVVPSEDDLAAMLTAVGLDPALAVAADDASLDADLRASMAEATDLVGDDVGVPILAVDGQAVFGPILAPAPTGDAALRLFDAVVATLTEPGFFELKRARTRGPALPERP
ncbi:MAG: DsbA family protein [Acidimicrobiia bacterium]|nr:DsbA family protein [Acidimicrobiia bacterium]